MDNKILKPEDCAPSYLSPEPDNIPQALREPPQWVLWWSVKDEERWEKRPVSIKGIKGKVNDHTTWGSFDEVVKTQRTLQDKLTRDVSHVGIGFVFTEEDPFVGIDLDKCIDGDGVLHPKAREIVEDFKSYTEYSVSGSGLHIITTGELLEGKRHGHIEVYPHGRFFTMTGHIFEGRNEIVSGGAALQKLYNYVQQSKSGKNKSSHSGYTRQAGQTGPGSPYKGFFCADLFSDEKLLMKIWQSKNGPTIKKLWDGDISAYDNDHSRADLALLSHLFWWCNGNEERVDRLFCQSELCRDKWVDRPDYRELCFAKLRVKESRQ